MNRSSDIEMHDSIFRAPHQGKPASNGYVSVGGEAEVVSGPLHDRVVPISEVRHSLTTPTHQRRYGIAHTVKTGGGHCNCGAIILMAGTMLHPLGADPGDPVAAFTEYAANDLWIGSHLSQFLGVAMMFVGLVALNDSLKGEPFACLARLGYLWVWLRWR